MNGMAYFIFLHDHQGLLVALLVIHHCLSLLTSSHLLSLHHLDGPSCAVHDLSFHVHATKSISKRELKSGPILNIGVKISK
jgi:hypothetical protein